MPPLTATHLMIHLLLSIAAGVFMGFVNAYGMNGYLTPPMGWSFWLIIMPLGWAQCLMALIGVTALLGGTRLPGVLLVLVAAGLVSLPLALEIRVLILLLDPTAVVDDPMVVSLGKCFAVSLVFSAVAWAGVERRPLGRPRCTWTMLGAGGPGAEVDMEEALRKLDDHLNRKLAESPAPALPFHPPVPVPPKVKPSPVAEPRPTPGSSPAPDPAPDPIVAPMPSAPPPFQKTEPEPDVPMGLRLTRMPEGLGGSILCIESEDHYLRVHTTEGQGMMLARLRDAVDELGPEAGAKVHRCWWVAREAVIGTEREGRKLELILANGQRIPVSRANQPRLEAEGWLDG